MPVSGRPVIERSRGEEYDALRPYLFHGMRLTVRNSHAIGDCPFCGREDKFSIAVDSGLWRCFVCGAGTANGGGNALVFLRLLHSTLVKDTQPRFTAMVAEDRRLVDPGTVSAWGVCKSSLARDAWLVPGYSASGRLDQIYRRTYIKDKGGDWSWRLLPTPGVWPDGRVHSLHMPACSWAGGDRLSEFYDVWIAEGPWDGMVLWEVVTHSYNPIQTLTPIVPVRLGIVSVPGCNVWRDDWTVMCRNKHVTLFFDSDHPREHNGNVFRAGYDGMCRIARKLRGVASSIKWIRWGPGGYDPSRPSGWDVRDALSAVNTLAERQKVLAELLYKIELAPKEWFVPVSPHSSLPNGSPQLVGSVDGVDGVDLASSVTPYTVASASQTAQAAATQPCDSWSTCEGAWKEAMEWRQDMSDALAVLLAVCASTKQAGNQLLLDLIGSAGSGKTTMCDGLLTSQHCHQLDHLTGFHSGWRKEGDPDKDCSLLARVNGKTLITAELDVLVSSPRYKEIMSQMRRMFDGKSSSTYKNSDEDRFYAALRMPWIRAGTTAMMDHDQSHLGDRFIRFIISDPTETEKRAILRKAVRSERAAVMESANCDAGSIMDSKTRLAHGLTGGYVDWLRTYVSSILPQLDISEDVDDYCMNLADLSADLRARPKDSRSGSNEYDSKELPTRLARQNMRLASFLAVVLNERTVGPRILRILMKVALDTAHGNSYNILRWLCSPNPKADNQPYQESGGLATETMAMWCAMTPDKMLRYLLFLQKIGVLEYKRVPQSNGAWILTKRTHDLYSKVIENHE